MDLDGMQGQTPKSHPMKVFFPSHSISDRLSAAALIKTFMIKDVTPISKTGKNTSNSYTNLTAARTSCGIKTLDL